MRPAHHPAAAPAAASNSTSPPRTCRQTGSARGFPNAELGLRFRYEIAREFAPHIGAS
ncbi:copper resistance protein B [Sphingomonas sp.]|uniref:copper resistance protein B n=1 Tax=Sphingomonas sp. TaxID=28214 RepID=UPI002DB8C0B4|nr:copper resistance protein B [Sphingomonas sp.]HEU4968910.1 copper resistance protein B [Sphingomonas sp.]